MRIEAMITPRGAAPVRSAESGSVRRGPVIGACVVAVSMAGACSDRKSSAPPQPSRPLADAAPTLPRIDAMDPELGPYERVRARFERDCPRDLPKYNGLESTAPFLVLQTTARSCERSAKDPQPSARPDVIRSVYLGCAADIRNVDYDTVVTPIATLLVMYSWTASKRPPQCDHVVDEGVEYMQELTGMPDHAAAQLAATMRAHPWKPETWTAVHLADQDFYFRYLDHSAKQAECFVDFSIPTLIKAASYLVETVTPVAGSPPIDGGSDAR